MPTETETEIIRGKSSTMQERPGREAEDVLELRAFDLRAFDNSSCPVSVSKSCTGVYNYWQSSRRINPAHLFLVRTIWD